jgi:predicted ATPase
MSFTTSERELLRTLYDEVRTKGAYPTIEVFRARAGKAAFDSLGERGFICIAVGHAQLRLRGLRAVGTKEAADDLGEIARVWAALQQGSMAEHDQQGLVKQLAPSDAVQRFQMREVDAARQLTFLEERLYTTGQSQAFWDESTGLIRRLVYIEDKLLKAAPPYVQPEEPQQGEAQGSPVVFPILNQLSADGYRALDRFSSSFGHLLVIIGANASGKSSLFDLLRFLSFASTSPLPPELDPSSAGRTLFHAGGPERIHVELVVFLERFLSLSYSLSISGPIGSPKVTVEDLVRVSDADGEPQIFITTSSSTERTVERAIDRYVDGELWSLAPNELTLRRTLDPTLVTASAFQRYISSWRFYTGFDTGPRSAVRRPTLIETAPQLASDGANLSAVLFWMMTEHREAWEELELRLRAAVPGFSSLHVKARGGAGTVLGIWREEGVTGELTLADLSDGTLHLLCWAALCLSPEPPPLVCIDEPEIGLHPRALPVVASLLRALATRTQVLVATHSPYLLAQFDLDQIAVMKKEGGKAVFRRPADQEGLRREIEELGGEELARMHVSDELEARS